MQEDAGKTKTVRARPTSAARAVAALVCLGFISACAEQLPEDIIDRERQEFALLEVRQKQARGQRVWCVPYARNLSGINLRGNAKDWWGLARGNYERGEKPAVGSVMSFQASGGMSLGHVAVVADVVADREIIVNHANWNRNKVSTKMGVVDVSRNNDWSLVRVESRPGQYGRPYPVNGFIYPKQGG